MVTEAANIMAAV